MILCWRNRCSALNILSISSVTLFFKLRLNDLKIFEHRSCLDPMSLLLITYKKDGYLE